jgi:S-(hydroxymethyl)glutathione dehydrogenase/alcohol dehydrogenase
VVRDVESGARVEEIEVDDPREGEVRVRLAASGVCGSDIHMLHGRSNAATFPMVLGHEGAGVVESVGPGVDGLAPGDHVVLALYGPCHACPSCAGGRFVHCSGESRVAAIFGRMADGSTRLRTTDGRPLHPMVGTGTLAEHAVVRAAQAVKVDDDLPLDLLCLAGCGVTTGLGAVLNIAEVAAGDTVAVVGCGGVGLNVVQGARIAGATTIVALDTNPAKLDLARRLGATHTLVPSLAPPPPAPPPDGGDRIAAPVRSRGAAQSGVEAGSTSQAGAGGAGSATSGGSGARSVADLVGEIVPGGVDFAFEVVGSPDLVAETFLATRPGGTCVMVGAMPPGATIPIDGRALFSDRRLRGCIGGNNVPAVDIPRITALHRQGRLDLDALVSARRPLDEVAMAIEETAQGAVARTVVVL